MTETCLTLISSAMIASSSGPTSRPRSGRASQAWASGWRVRIRAELRSVRARSTASCATAIARSSRASRCAARPAAGQRVEMHRIGPVRRSRSRGSRTSRRTGTAGSARACRPSPSSASWSVANAAARSAASSLRRIRSRDRRTYQVERPSMNRDSSRVAATASNARRCLLDGGRGPGRARQDPAVERAALGDRRRIAGDRRPAGQPGVRHEERVDVPEHQQLAARLVRRVPAEEDVLLRPRLGEHPAHDVDAHPLGGLVEVDRVAPRLVHRPAVLAEDQAVAEDRLERPLAAEDRRHREHRVEPVAELPGEALGDEVGREPLRPVRPGPRGSGASRTARSRRPATGCRRRGCARPARRTTGRRWSPRRPTGGAACGPRTAPSRRPPARAARRGRR